MLLTETVRAHLRNSLKPVALKKGEGDFEIGREVTKLGILLDFEGLLGGPL